MPEGTKIASIATITHHDTLLITVRNGELLCRKHGVAFEKDSGYCPVGPCEGATLDSVDVAENNGAVYLTDECPSSACSAKPNPMSRVTAQGTLANDLASAW